MDHEAYKQSLKEKYSQYLKPQKSLAEVEDYLKQRFDMKNVSLEEEDPIFLHIAKLNCLHSLKNQKLNLNIDEFTFVAYEILQNKKSEDDYKLSRECLGKDTKIFVLIEKNTEEITSNWEKLKIELIIERGICQYHCEKETPEYFGHLVTIESYHNGKC